MIRRKFSRGLALSWPELRVVVMAALLLPAIWVGLRVIGFARIHAWAAGSRGAPAAAPEPHSPAAVGALVNMAGGVMPFFSTCLTRSLALVWILGRHGVPRQLRIGVRTADERFDAHAWVEHDGLPINDSPGVSERFAVLDSIGGHVPRLPR
jgi:hypothetical protein